MSINLISKLTAKQRHAFDLISEGCLNGRAPTVREIAAEMGCSVGAAQNLVQSLIRDGALLPADSQWRGLRPVELLCPHCGKDLIDRG